MDHRQLVSFIQTSHEMGKDVLTEWKDLFKVWRYWHVERGDAYCVHETTFKHICESVKAGKTPSTWFNGWWKSFKQTPPSPTASRDDMPYMIDVRIT